MSDADLVTGLRSLNRCIRCDCNACISGQENHEHICSGDKGCVAPLEPRLRKAIVLGGSAANRIEALAAEVERLASERDELVTIGRRHQVNAESAERALAEAVEIMKRQIANACAAAYVMPNGAHRIDATQDEWLAHVEATTAARDFITAQGKEKGSNA